MSTTDRRYVGRDERKLVPLEDQARANGELHDLVMALTPEQRLMATFVHYPGSSDAPQLAEIWVAPGARIHPSAQDRHGVGFVIGGEIELAGQTLGAGSSFFIPRGVTYSYRAGPQGVTFLGFRPTRPPDVGLNSLHGGWGADDATPEGAESASTIRTVRAEERKWEVLQDRAEGNPVLQEIVRALPPDERVTASFVHFRGSPDEPQLIEIWLPPGIRIAPFTQELYTLGFSLWGENAGSSNSSQPGVAGQPFQVGPRGASSIGFRPIRPPHLTVHTVHGGP